MNCRASLAVFSGSLPFAYPPPGDQPGHLVLSGDVDHCQSCNFFSQPFNYIFGRIFTPGMDEQREAVRAAYAGLREHYPALPEQLRDFQVLPWDLKRMGLFNHKFSRQILLLVQSMRLSHAISWGLFRQATESPCQCLSLVSSCLLVSVLVEKNCCSSK